MHPARDGSPQGQGFRREPFAAQAAAHPGPAREAAAQDGLSRPTRPPFLRLAFAGTPEFAARALEALVGAGHEIALVLTQPDRPAGRGLQPAASAVKKLALSRGLMVHQPASLRDPAAILPLAAAHAEVLVVAAYGLLLPASVLSIAPRGAVNIHASLLPRWRGAAPIQRALLAGDRETGITIMQMDEGLDTGPMLLRRAIQIEETDDAGTLHDKLAVLGAQAIVEALDAMSAGGLEAVPQPATGATYARKLVKEDAEIDWSQPCEVVSRQVRGMRPSPGARTQIEGTALKVWRGSCEQASGSAGTLVSADARGLLVACGTGGLRIIELQKAGGNRLAAADFLRGFPLHAGMRLGAAR